jgi:hypothetical protein
MAKKSSKGQGKAKGHGKAKRKPSKVKDLAMGSRTARSVKGGSFSFGKQSSGTTLHTAGARNMFTI